MKIFIVMGVGILIGRFLMTGRIKKWNERLAMLCTLLLIFSMGVMLGQKENFLSELSSLGLKSFLFFLIPTLVSSPRCSVPGLQGTLLSNRCKSSVAVRFPRSIPVLHISNSAPASKVSTDSRLRF